MARPLVVSCIGNSCPVYPYSLPWSECPYYHHLFAAGDSSEEALAVLWSVVDPQSDSDSPAVVESFPWTVRILDWTLFRSFDVNQRLLGWQWPIRVPVHPIASSQSVSGRT